jgi:RNA polymerase sigma factor (sigma-70 family)
MREFLSTSYPRLVAAVALVAGRAMAEDAVQEALLRAWERSERGERIESLPAWVTRVALNLSNSRLRRMRAERKAVERSTAPATSEGSPEDRVDIHRALALLPRKQREAVVLRYYLQFDVSQIAAIMHVGEGTTKKALFRARASLAKSLGESELEEVSDRDHR